MGVVFLGLLAIGCTVVLRPFVSAILWAAILCFATWPVYRRLEGAIPGRKNLAAALMTTLIALVLVLPFAVAGFTFADNVGRLAQQIHGFSNQGVPVVPSWVDHVPLLGNWLRNYWQTLHENTELAAATIQVWFDKLTPWLLRSGLSLGYGILQLALSVFIAFFFYRDGLSVVASVQSALKRITGDYAHRLIETVSVTVRSVVYGSLGTALAQGIMAGIGFTLAGIPAALLWALLCFMLALIPAGPPLVWVPATIWLFARGETGAGIFLALWGLICISGIDNLVRPFLISRGNPLPFALTLLGVMGGILAFGFIGLFLGPTLLAAGYSLVQEFVRRKNRGPAPA